MTPKKYKYRAMLLLVLSISWLGLFAATSTEKVDVTKRVTKEFVSNASTTLDVSNLW